MLVRVFSEFTGLDDLASSIFVGVFIAGMMVLVISSANACVARVVDRPRKQASRPSSGGAIVAGRDLRGVPPADEYGVRDGTAETCPEAGSKNCELRGCAIFGSCQRL